jgi:hypothetical protein
LSVPLEEPGWNHRRIALAWAELMRPARIHPVRRSGRRHGFGGLA